MVVPGHAAVVGRRIGRRRLVQDLGVRLERDEAVREADRYEQLAPVLRRQLDADVLSEARGRPAHVDRHVENASPTNPNKFVLSKGQNLEMQSAQGADCGGKRMVVLNKGKMEARGVPGRFAVDLGEEPARVPELFRGQDLDRGDRQFFNLHRRLFPRFSAPQRPLWAKPPCQKLQCAATAMRVNKGFVRPEFVMLSILSPSSSVRLPRDGAGREAGWETRSLNAINHWKRTISKDMQINYAVSRRCFDTRAPS